MPNDTKLIIQVAKLEEKMESVENNSNTRFDDLKSDIKDIKIGLLEQDKDFSKFKELVMESLNQTKTDRLEISNNIAANKKQCDDRYESSEKGKRTKLAIIIFLATTAFNIGIEAIKKLAGLA